MGRSLRTSLGGYVYHALNRGNGRETVFFKDADYDAFLRLLSWSRAFREHVPEMRLLAYCLMPNHWHLVLWPRNGGELSDYLHWLTLTHTQRWHAHYQNAGVGHLYQGRFKSFPIAEDDHLLSVCRYVERNALRAGLAARAEDWRWCSLAQRAGKGSADAPQLDEGPVALPADWIALVNQPHTEAELISFGGVASSVGNLMAERHGSKERYHAWV